MQSNTEIVREGREKYDVLKMFRYFSEVLLFGEIINES